jgi:hypothetical protein
MSNMVVGLKPLDLVIKDGFLIYLIFNSLPKEFETFEVNYNSMNEKWIFEKFMAMCVQEEEGIKHSNCGVDSVNLSKYNHKKRNFVSKPSPKNEEKGNSMAKPPAKRDQCKWCFKRGHYQKICNEFLKYMNREGEDHVIFVDESLFLSYAKSTWWIDSGATIHIANSLQGFISWRTF